MYHPVVITQKLASITDADQELGCQPTRNLAVCLAAPGMLLHTLLIRVSLIEPFSKS